MELKESYSPEDWNIILSEKPDPKAKLKKEILKMPVPLLRKKIANRLVSLESADLLSKFKGRSRKRLVKLYTWLIDLYDDSQHSWPFLEKIRRSNEKRFLIN